MKKFIILVFITCSFLFSKAQKGYNEANFGFGRGINYGGYGVNISGFPNKYLSVSIFGGYNFVKLNAGAGFSIYLRAPDKTFRPNLKTIYGCNGSIIVRDTRYFSSNVYISRENYYGWSVGLGFPFISEGRPQYGFDFDLFYPFRSDSFYHHYNSIKNNPDLFLDNKITKVTLSFSFHISF